MLQLEDIYGSLFLVQCDVKLVRARHRLGQKQSMFIKFCSGVLLFTVLIAVIWAPMLVHIFTTLHTNPMGACQACTVDMLRRLKMQLKPDLFSEMGAIFRISSH